ncbi:hypothetical protein [Actinomadura monticuli]|uniref:DUF397 domain-containing protein n=1 Tax=Actinomadura monticuli TaxID=3097367 RepID=A0ABV4Q5V1_9ACTN
MVVTKDAGESDTLIDGGKGFALMFTRSFPACVAANSEMRGALGSRALVSLKRE